MPVAVSPLVAAPVTLPASSGGMDPSKFPFFSDDWTQSYSSCPRWSDPFQAVAIRKEFLERYHWDGKRLYLEEKMCVPNALVESVLKAYHERTHCGAAKLKVRISRRLMSAAHTACKIPQPFRRGKHV